MPIGESYTRPAREKQGAFGDCRYPSPEKIFAPSAMTGFSAQPVGETLYSIQPSAVVCYWRCHELLGSGQTDFSVFLAKCRKPITFDDVRTVRAGHA